MPGGSAFCAFRGGCQIQRQADRYASGTSMLAAAALDTHASPTEGPGRACCHSTPPKDLMRRAGREQSHIG